MLIKTSASNNFTFKSEPFIIFLREYEWEKACSPCCFLSFIERLPEKVCFPQRKDVNANTYFVRLFTGCNVSSITCAYLFRASSNFNEGASVLSLEGSLFLPFEKFCSKKEVLFHVK